MSEPMNFPPHLEKLVRTTVNDGMASIAERAMLREITDLRSRLADAERERAKLDKLLQESDNYRDFCRLKQTVAELAGALRQIQTQCGNCDCDGGFCEWCIATTVLAKHGGGK